MTTSQPISASQFALAIADLPLSTLSLKAAEIRNSIVHLDYSNEQLLPFTETSPPDADCVDAIKENEVVIKRMLERIELLKKEVEGRGVAWEELSGEARKEETVVDGFGRAGEEEVVNGDESRAAGSRSGGNPWTDGTFTTGRIVNGEVHTDDVAGASNVQPGNAEGSNGVITNGVNGNANATANSNGGRLDDEALRRAVEERMRNLDTDEGDDGGIHL